MGTLPEETPEIKTNFKQLEELYLDQNEAISFAGINELRNLKILSAKLVNARSTASLKDHPSLSKLILNGNELEKTEGLGSIQTLRHLELKQNEIKDDPRKLKCIKNIKYSTTDISMIFQ